MQQITFQTDDDVTLGGFLLTSDTPKAAVLLNPGTATKTTFYLPFAKYLASNGFNVLLWNYRGFCESRTFDLKHSFYRFSDIGRYDIPAAIDCIKSNFPELPVYCVGHSTGGQQLGIAANCSEISGLIAVASSAGYFRNMPVAYRLKAYFFFKCFAPLSSLLVGYVAAKRFKLMEDVTAPLAKEWGQWCEEEDLYFSSRFLGESIPQNAYKNVKFPIYVLYADDDEISTQQNIENFWKHVTGQLPIQYKCYISKAIAHKGVGHFGYFKRQNIVIWDDIVTLINKMISQDSGIPPR